MANKYVEKTPSEEILCKILLNTIKMQLLYFNENGINKYLKSYDFMLTS